MLSARANSRQPSARFAVKELMAQYVFQGPDLADSAGAELPDDAAAREVAMDMFGQMIREMTARPGCEEAHHLIVSNGPGKPVLVLTLSVTAR